MNGNGFGENHEVEDDDVFEEEDVFTRVSRGRRNRNPYISTMKEDRLYHIGLVSGPQDMVEMFGDVKVRLYTTAVV